MHSEPKQDLNAVVRLEDRRKLADSAPVAAASNRMPRLYVCSDNTGPMKFPATANLDRGGSADQLLMSVSSTVGSFKWSRGKKQVPYRMFNIQTCSVEEPVNNQGRSWYASGQHMDCFRNKRRRRSRHRLGLTAVRLVAIAWMGRYVHLISHANSPKDSLPCSVTYLSLKTAKVCARCQQSRDSVTLSKLSSAGSAD